MLIPATAPKYVTEMEVGTVFYATAPRPQLLMVCADDADPQAARYVAALPAEDERDAESGQTVAGIHELGEFKGQAAVPLSGTKALFTPPYVQRNCGGGVPKLDALAYVDGAGCWMPIKERWLNLSTGLLSSHRPTAPWVELGDVQLQTADGEALAHWSVFS